MTKSSKAQIEDAQAQAKAQLEHLQNAHQAFLAETAGEAEAKAAAVTSAPTPVSGQASFAMAFIYGTMTFNPDQIGLSFYAGSIWGVGLSGGVSYVAGLIDQPSKGEHWDVNINNTPGVVTGLSINFFKNGRPVGSVVGPALSGGIGMIAGGSGSWS